MGATQLADLPEGVLSKVLGHLSLREWVYAAATCRALQDVQPDAIYMSKWCRPDAKGASLFNLKSLTPAPEHALRHVNL